VSALCGIFFVAPKAEASAKEDEDSNLTPNAGIA
jgi:hypothetical protein